MKVIITGATGYVGTEVLKQSLASDKIDSVVVLTRRPLAESSGIDTSNPKLSVVVHEDFLQYPPSVLSKLEGAGAVIWSIGQKPGKTTTSADVRKVNVDFPMAAARAFNGTVKPAEGPFRFVYVSGGLIERDQTKKLWFMEDFRKVRGQLENELVAFQNPQMSTFITRPQGIIENAVATTVLPFLTIKTSAYAAALIDIALNGNEKQTLENGDLKNVAKKAQAV